MIARSHRGRSGITLTEILIAILIMGVGLISLATLFPLGLLRLRDAARFQRGGMLAQSATDDFDARSLLLKSSFAQTWYGPDQDPFTRDATLNGGAYPPGGAVSTYGSPLPGLPVCYDPLFRAVTNVVPLNDALYDGTLDYAATYRVGGAEARFGAGLVTNAAGNTLNAFGLEAGTTASAHGLQRITNFIPWSSNLATPLYPFTYQNPNLVAFPNQPVDMAGDTFTSRDDIVFNASDTRAGSASPVLPFFEAGSTVASNDWKYTWFFTGRQVDSTNGTMFQGDIVVCDGRPFVFGPSPVLPAVSAPVGEVVVEAIFGFSSNITANANAASNTALGADRTVLLRWPTSMPDPTVRAGGWIADVTYERDQAVSNTRFGATGFPFQRCHWYQVIKRTDVQPDPLNANYRRTVVTINTPVRAKTTVAVDANNNVSAVAGGSNVALLMNSVINVYPRTFTIH